MDEKELLHRLHTSMIKNLLEKIESGEATAADLGVARQFLKDNGIDTVAKQGAPILRLADSLPFDPAEDDVPKYA